MQGPDACCSRYNNKYLGIGLRQFPKSLKYFATTFHLPEEINHTDYCEVTAAFKIEHEVQMGIVTFTNIYANSALWDAVFNCVRIIK